MSFSKWRFDYIIQCVIDRILQIKRHFKIFNELFKTTLWLHISLLRCKCYWIVKFRRSTKFAIEFCRIYWILSNLSIEWISLLEFLSLSFSKTAFSISKRISEIFLKNLRTTFILYKTIDCDSTIVILCTRKFEFWNAFSIIAFEQKNKNIYDLNW